VLTDPDYPGWSATLDGAPVSIARADGGFRAVHLPAREHRVDLTYRPPVLRLGLGLSFAALLVLVAVGGWPPRPAPCPHP
jgi:uncharacterized membrane protein YfhO